MHTTIGIRDLANNYTILDGYDYVDIEDKKTKEHKGVFISSKYANEFKEFLDNKKTQAEQEWEKIEKFIGSMECEDRYKGLDGKELVREVAKAKCGKE